MRKSGVSKSKDRAPRFVQCAFVRPRVPCVSCVSRLPRCLFTGTMSRLPPVSFYRYNVLCALGFSTRDRHPE
jgi:hypothetical protein